MNNNSNSLQIILTIFSNASDDSILLECILCLSDSLPNAKIVIIDDSNNPCSSRTRKLVEIMGACWKTSSWNTQGNSPKILKRLLQEMLSHSHKDDDILIKLDPNTALLDASELYEFARSKKILWASGYPDTQIFGNLFAIKAGAARTLQKILASAFEENDLYWEREIKDILMEAHKEKSKDIFSFWWLAGTLLPWSKYNWESYPDISSYQRHAVVITGDSSSHSFKPEWQANLMRELRLDRQ